MIRASFSSMRRRVKMWHALIKWLPNILYKSGRWVRKCYLTLSLTFTFTFLRAQDELDVDSLRYRLDCLLNWTPQSGCYEEIRSWSCWDLGSFHRHNHLFKSQLFSDCSLICKAHYILYSWIGPQNHDQCQLEELYGKTLMTRVWMWLWTRSSSPPSREWISPWAPGLSTAQHLALKKQHCPPKLDCGPRQLRSDTRIPQLTTLHQQRRFLAVGQTWITRQGHSPTRILWMMRWICRLSSSGQGDVYI